jgi:hypothetical protein
MSYLQKAQSAGDREPNISALEPSDIPGFMNPRGRKDIYIPESDQSQQLTKQQAMAMFQKQGQTGRGNPLYPTTP